MSLGLREPVRAPVEDPEVARRAAGQERFCTDLAADRHRTGRRGTVVLVGDDTDVLRRRHQSAALCRVAREMVGAGFGVLLRRPAAVSAGPGVPADLVHAVAVVSVSPDLDPAVVPRTAVCTAWVLDRLDSWRAHRRLAVYDRMVAGSGVAAAVVSGVAGLPVGIVLPAPDTAAFTRRPSGVGVPRELVTVVATGDLGKVSDALRPAAAAGVLRVHAPRAAVPAALRAWARPPLRAAQRPAAFAASMAVVLPDADAIQLGSGIVDVVALEAAAAGAVPVVRTRLGLAEQGLPTAVGAVSTGSLRSAVSTLVHDHGVTRSAGAVLAAAMAATGTAAASADRVRELTGIPDAVASARLGPVDPAPGRPTLGFFPDLQRTNPYQRMLYRRLTADGVRVAPVRDGLTRAVLRDDGGRLDDQVFHLHWTSIVVQDGTSVFDAAGRLARFTARVEDLLARGARLVWTIHNVVSHDVRYPDLEVQLCQYLADRAAMVHVLGDATVEAAAPWYRLDPAKVAVVPHASYLGEYPDWVPRSVARTRLGLDERDVVLLAAGGIRPYRGLDRLLDVFDELVRVDPRLRLVVTGRPGREPVVQGWLDRCRAHPRITLRAGHVGDDELQVFHRAADLAVLPYRAILNSGAFGLAQGFGLPVVGPRAGNLRAAVDRPGSIGFDPADLGDLAAAVRTGIDVVDDPVRGPAARAAARAAAAAYGPTQMADDFAAALTDRGILPAPGDTPGDGRRG